MHVRVDVLDQDGGPRPNDSNKEDEEEAQGVGGGAFGTPEVALEDHGSVVRVVGWAEWGEGRAGFGGRPGARGRETLHGNCEMTLSPPVSDVCMGRTRVSRASNRETAKAR